MNIHEPTAMTTAHSILLQDREIDREAMAATSFTASTEATDSVCVSECEWEKQFGMLEHQLGCLPAAQ